MTGAQRLACSGFQPGRLRSSRFFDVLHFHEKISAGGIGPLAGDFEKLVMAAREKTTPEVCASKMEELIDAPETVNVLVNVCPVCDRLADELFMLASVPEELSSIIKPNAATPNPDQVCSRCIDLFTRALRQIESQAAIFEQNDFVLPTPLTNGRG